MRPRGLGRGLGALIPAASSDRAAAVAAEAEVPAEPSETVRALDRWLWRAGEAELPSIPGPGPARSAAADGGETDVPRGTSAALTAVAEAPGEGDADHAEVTAPDAGAEPVEVAREPSGEAVSATADRPLVSPGGAVFAELDPTRIRPNPRQPRTIFDPDSLAELAASIIEVGLLQPVVVRDVGAGTYELVVGERRLRACQLAGLDRIPAIVRATDDDVLLRDALLENIQRVQLNPLEEAAAYGQLLEDFGCTQDELATRLGRSRPQVTNTLRLLRLSPPVQRRVAAGVLSAGHAKALLGLTDAGAQETLAGRIVAEGLSVRSVEELVSAGSPGGSVRQRPGRSALPSAGADSAVADRLAARLDTRVTVSRGRARGRLVIEFANWADLVRIAGLIDPSATSPGEH